MPATPITQKKSLQLDVNEQIECAQTLASRFHTNRFGKLRKRRFFTARGNW